MSGQSIASPVLLAIPRPVLVDSNVLIDILGDDARWFEWSAAALRGAVESSRLILNPLVFAEVSVGFAALEALDEALSGDYWAREELPWEAAFLAGKCYLEYRRKGGQKRSPLPDFYIGAHAAVRGYRLLTRDPSRYRTYFPKLELIAPS